MNYTVTYLGKYRVYFCHIDATGFTLLTSVLLLFFL